MRMFKFTSAIIFGVTVFASAYAQQQDAIVFTNEAFKEVEVVNEKGEKEYKLVPPGTVLPEDEIVYIITFANKGNEPVEDIAVTSPVPNDSYYKAGSAFGSGTDITFSVDGGQAYGKADVLQVDGESASPEDYTHIRWLYTSPLAPQQQSTVMYRTVVK